MWKLCIGACDYLSGVYGSYELQLKADLRGQGMGKVLMDLMENIGAERGMAKSMLTCMKSE